MDEVLELRTPAQFRALGHPLRHRLFNVLRQRPATLGQLASALGSTKGTVGYHVQLMVDAGVLRLAGTRRVRGGTERYYEPVSRVLRHDPDAEAGTAFLVQAALDEMLPHRPGDPDFALLRHIQLTPAKARELADQVRRFGEQVPVPGSEHAPGSEHQAGSGERQASSGERQAGSGERQAGSGGEPHGLLFCLYRADIPALPPE